VKPSRFRGVVLALALLGAWSLHQAGRAGEKAGQPPVPATELSNLIAQDVKVLQEALAKTPLDKKTTRKAKATALMLAAYAELTGSPGLHTEALAALKALDDNDVTKAQQLAAKLPVGKTAGPALKKVNLSKLVNTETLMRQMGGVKVGGFGYEKELEDLGDSKGDLSKEQLSQVGRMADKTAIIALLAKGQVPDQDEDAKKTRKSWLTYSEMMEQSAAALGRAARAGNQAEVRTALGRLNDSCAKCHEIWR
jgi:hypothetical protein